MATLHDFTSTFMDDICLYSKDELTHLDCLEVFFKRLEECNMVLNSEKCEFFVKKVNMLGFEVCNNEVIPAKVKLDGIENYPRPTDVTGVRAFVNCCGYFRRHGLQFSDIAVPLNDLLRKGVSFVWTEKQEKAFKLLKQAVCAATKLILPEAGDAYRLYTYASEVAIAGTLTLMKEKGGKFLESPICFISRKMLPAEVNLYILEKECLAVIYLLGKLREYLQDKHFDLYTDSLCMTYLHRKCDSSPKLQRWILATQEFSFTIHHLSSKKNCVSDALSRYPPIGDISTAEILADALLDVMYDNLLIPEKEEPVNESWLNLI